MTGTPYPAPLSFECGDHLGGGDITAADYDEPIATVCSVRDMTEEHRRGTSDEQLQDDLNATGRKLILAYNTHGPAVDWLKRFLAASVHVADDTGILARYREEGLALLGSMTEPEKT